MEIIKENKMKYSELKAGEFFRLGGSDTQWTCLYLKTHDHYVFIGNKGSEVYCQEYVDTFSAYCDITIVDSQEALDLLSDMKWPNRSVELRDISANTWFTHLEEQDMGPCLKLKDTYKWISQPSCFVPCINEAGEILMFRDKAKVMVIEE